MEFRFGLHNEIQIPRPWRPRTEYEAFKHTVEQAVLADQVGFEWWSTVEHHFLCEFSHSSAPEVLYPYVAARTENVRIGHAVRLLPFPYNHPVRLAEEAAMLDLLCDGRLEFGVGRSVSWDELHGFGINPADTRAEADEEAFANARQWFEWTTKLAIDVVLSVAHQVPAVNPANGAVSAIDPSKHMGSYEYLRPFIEFDKNILTLDFLVENGMVICG